MIICLYIVNVVLLTWQGRLGVKRGTWFAWKCMLVSNHFFWVPSMNNVRGLGFLYKSCMEFHSHQQQALPYMVVLNTDFGVLLHDVIYFFTYIFGILFQLGVGFQLFVNTNEWQRRKRRRKKVAQSIKVFFILFSPAFTSLVVVTHHHIV